ncbi:MAG: peptidase U32 family protein [Terriglobales bacterium]
MNFELNTGVSNLRNLLESDLSAYDAVYLGNIYCRVYEQNFLESLEDLKEGIARVHDQGRKAYVSTYAAPRNDVLPKIRKALETAAVAGADAIEAHNMGVLRIAHEEFPSLKVHIGGFANVYTDAGASVLKQHGAERITPNYEISLEEVNLLTKAAGVPAEILVHGKMPLGVSDYCFLLEYENNWEQKCPALCQQPLFLRQGDWAMRTVGKGVMSGRDVCMLEHLPALWAAGHRTFRIEAAYESPAYRREIGALYRDALQHAGGENYKVTEQNWEIVQRHTPVGLCNGFYFGRTGGEYVGQRAEALSAGCATGVH